MLIKLFAGFIIEKVKKKYDNFRHNWIFNKPDWYHVGSDIYMYLNPNDIIDRLFFSRSYDNILIKIIKSYVRSEDLCIDVGAQKGYVSLYLSKQVGHSGTVLAFEPDKNASVQLEKNLERNKIKNIITYSCALGESERTTTFHLSSQIGWSTIYPNELARSTIVETVDVRIMSLDSILSELTLKSKLKNLSFIKIDCEGSEPQVLMGMKSTLRASCPIIYIEINESSLLAAGKNIKTILTFFDDLGYVGYKPEIRNKNGKQIIYNEVFKIDQFANSEVFNLLFIKKGYSKISVETKNK